MYFTITRAVVVSFVLYQYGSVCEDLKMDIKWVEEMDEEGNNVNMDIFFDRVVMIIIKSEKKVLCTGILHDSHRVLTSYNPILQMIRQGKQIQNDLVVGILTGRRFNSNTFSYEHRIVYRKIICHYRPHGIDVSLTAEQYHGTKQIHSPVHDLYQLRIDPINYTDIDNDRQFTTTGSKITIFAKRTDSLENDNLKFASLGYIDEEHITKNETRLSSYEYEAGTNVILDCDEWIIRDWGRFICLKNPEDFYGIASGAVLIQNDKLYGIGSFTMNKGNVSIFVFTDVREYRRNVLNLYCYIINKKPPHLEGLWYVWHIIMDSEKYQGRITYLDVYGNLTLTTTPKSLIHLGREGEELEEW